MDDERSVAGGSADEAVPDQRADAADHDKDPAEQEALARDLGEELTDLFARYVRGEVDFAELTFATYDMLQDLHIIASGAYELEYEDDEDSSDDSDDSSDDSSDDEGDDEGDEDGAAEPEEDEADDEAAESAGTEAEEGEAAVGDYDVKEATEEQEDLAQEPARP